jgi:hypothetical protein
MPYGFVLMHSLVGPAQPKNPSAAPAVSVTRVIWSCTSGFIRRRRDAHHRETSAAHVESFVADAAQW